MAIFRRYEIIPGLGAVWKTEAWHPRHRQLVRKAEGPSAGAPYHTFASLLSSRDKVKMRTLGGM
jgi:hypothetical protein